MLWAPLEPLNLADPFPMYRRLREEDPLHHAQTGEWIITRYDDIKYILKDPRCLSGNKLRWIEKGLDHLHNAESDLRSAIEALGAFLIFKNPPDHTRLRSFITGCWQNRQMDEAVGRIVGELVRGLPLQADVDLVDQVANKLPARVISKLLGVPDKDHAILKELSSTIIKSLDLYLSASDLAAISASSAKFIKYFSGLIAEGSFREGLIKTIIETNRKESVLDDTQLISILIQLFVAGEETTASLISTGMLTLLEHPREMQRLRDDPALIDTAVEEILRFSPPVHILGRIAREEMAIGSRKIPAGSTLTLILASGNRDHLAFQDPEVFDIARQPNRHLSFGNGIHYCMGDWLARAEARTALSELVGRFPKMKLLDTKPHWKNNLAIRGLNHLSVKLA